MPYEDGTGPFGEGPMTGRGMGPCARDPALRRRFARFGFRRGFNRGFGRGFARFDQRFRRWPVQDYEDAITKDEEKKILEAELKDIEAEKQEIAKRIKELK